MQKNILLYFLLLLAQVGYGQLVPTSMTSLLLASDVRSMSLGNASISLDGDNASSLTNPAKLAYGDDINTLSFNIIPYGDILRNAKILNTKYVFNTKSRNKIGVSLNYFNGGSINIRDDYGVTQGSYKYCEYAIGVSYGILLSDAVSLGTTIRMVNQSTANMYNGAFTPLSGYGLSADIGLLDNIFIDEYNDQKIQIGLGFQNIGNKINDYYQPMMFSLGATYIDGYNHDNSSIRNSPEFMIGFEIKKPLIPTQYEGNRIATSLNPYNNTIIDNLIGNWSNLNSLRYILFGEMYFNQLIYGRAGYSYENINKGFGTTPYGSIGFGLNLEKCGKPFTINPQIKIDNNSNNKIGFQILFKL
jgi:hypothetical protein